MRTLDELRAFIALAHERGQVAFDVRMSSLDALQAELVGVSLAVNPGEACYIPIGHRVGADDLFSGGGLVPDQIPEADAIALLKPLMEAQGVLKIGHDVKFGMQAFAERGVSMAPIDDAMLLSYALDGGSRASTEWTNSASGSSATSRSRSARSRDPVATSSA